jgi:hypothetical protein
MLASLMRRLLASSPMTREEST